MAGANAALRVLERDPLIITRGQGYIGVMTDDLTANVVDEPYRMFTSRAEYRLLLREDNATTRLCPLAISTGLLTREQQELFESKNAIYKGALSWLQTTRVKPNAATNAWLLSKGTAELKDSATLAQLLKRPQLTLGDILQHVPYDQAEFSADLLAALEIETKFSGYLDRQEEEVQRLKRIETDAIPSDFPYEHISQLRTEAREKLKKHRPATIGQAMRIPGMTPSTISLLAIYLKRYRDGSLHTRQGDLDESVPTGCG
jgi:tRNA uridine 5-carboxymethylaminomethyl modification enzyme